MKTITKKLNSVLAAVLTMAALAVGQNAWATTKTVTYTITNSIQIGNGNNNYRVTMTRSGDAPFDNSGPNYTVDMTQSSLYTTNGSYGDYTFTLADGFKLQMSWGSGTNVTFEKVTGSDIFYIGPVIDKNNTKNITYRLSCPDAYYYVTNVTIRGKEGVWFTGSGQQLTGSSLLRC